MKQRKLTLASQLETEMFSYEMKCSCGVRFSPKPGKPSARAQYLCWKCRKELTVTVTQIRSEEEARFNLRNAGRFNGEVCADCGARFGHRVEERPDLEEGVHFLWCGACGEEMREVEPGELREEQGE